MRLLFVHSDHLAFETTGQVDEDVAEVDGVPMAGRMEDCVTVFVSVESGDAGDPAAVVANAADELRDVAGQLNADRVVLYPYAHLSDDLADPATATAVMRDLEDELADEFELLRAPFGWYKSFEVACKGHPLSELSRHVSAHRDEAGSPAGAVGEAGAAGEAAAGRESSDWLVLTPDGEELDPVAEKDRFGTDLRALIADEVEGEVAGPGEEPPHVELMQAKALAGYDDLSDAGNLRWYPRGKLVRDSLMEYVTGLVVEYGGMPVETPVMYDLGVRAVSEHARKFGERQYRFDSGDRRMMLRFAACFGQFSIMRDMHVSASDLPLRIYELSTYSFRREQRGEVVGLERLRAFTMPDMHTATRDLAAAREEFERQTRLAMRTGEDLGLAYEAAFRVTREFHEANRDWMESVVEGVGTPVLVEVIPERRHYWSAKMDLAVIDALGRPIENPTVQIDVESAERFEIEYTDAEGAHHPPILHYSPSGGIERVVAGLLETAATRDVPRLPTWLSPTQVRFVPVREAHEALCDDLVGRLEDAEVRADVDDRNESVGKRIATAETDWVPYYVVVGDREVESGEFGVNVRETGEERLLSFEELVETVDENIGDLPRRPRYLPARVSKHPNFTGR